MNIKRFVIVIIVCFIGSGIAPNISGIEDVKEENNQLEIKTNLKNYKKVNEGDRLTICDKTENQSPTPPDISGKTRVNPGIMYDYSFVSYDDDNDQIFYFVEWGDGSNSGWSKGTQSGKAITIAKSWSAEGTYTIRAKAKDIKGYESEWSSIKVRVPKLKSFYDSFLYIIIERLFQ
jgi:hypothetical protein